MAFDSDDLHLVGGGSGQRLWLYNTTDTIATVNTAAYFTGEAVNMLQVNDVIIVASSTGGTPVVSHTYVNSNDGSAVDVVDGVAVTATDSD